jgi:hypothetical protein
VNEIPLMPAPIVRRLGVLGLLLLVTVAAVLRSRNLDDPLWVDELHTAWAVSGSSSDLIPRAQAGNQAPAALLPQWLASRFLGVDELTLRLPSYLASLALVALVPLMVFRFGGGWAGALLSGVLVVVDYWSVEFACEARPYALVQLVSLLHGWCLLGRMGLTAQPSARGGRWWRAGWLVTAVLLVMLHYTTLLLIFAGMLAWWLLPAGRSDRDSVKGWLVDHLVLVLACLPLIPHLAMVAGRRANWAQFVEIPSLLDSLTLLPVAAYLSVPLLGWGLTRLRPYTRQIAAKDSSAFQYQGLDLHSEATSTGYLLPADDEQSSAAPLLVLGTLVLVLLATAWLSTRLDLARLFFPRYVIGASGLLIVLSGLLIGRLRGSWVVRLALLLGSLLVGLGVSGEAARTWQIGPRQEYWPALLTFLDASDPEGKLPVFLCPGLIEDRSLLADTVPPVDGIPLDEFCLFPLSGPYRLANQPPALVPLASSPVRWPPRAQRLTRQAGGSWLIVRGGHEGVLAWTEQLLGNSLQVRIHEFGQHLYLLRLVQVASPAPGK